MPDLCLGVPAELWFAVLVKTSPKSNNAPPVPSVLPAPLLPPYYVWAVPGLCLSVPAESWFAVLVKTSCCEQ